MKRVGNNAGEHITKVKILLEKKNLLIQHNKSRSKGKVLLQLLKPYFN